VKNFFHYTAPIPAEYKNIRFSAEKRAVKQCCGLEPEPEPPEPYNFAAIKTGTRTSIFL
jgi:hypothetical protein